MFLKYIDYGRVGVGNSWTGQFLDGDMAILDINNLINDNKDSDNEDANEDDDGQDLIPMIMSDTESVTDMEDEESGNQGRLIIYEGAEEAILVTLINIINVM